MSAFRRSIACFLVMIFLLAAVIPLSMAATKSDPYQVLPWMPDLTWDLSGQEMHDIICKAKPEIFIYKTNCYDYGGTGEGTIVCIMQPKLNNRSNDFPIFWRYVLQDLVSFYGQPTRENKSPEHGNIQYWFENSYVSFSVTAYYYGENNPYAMIIGIMHEGAKDKVRQEIYGKAVSLADEGKAEEAQKLFTRLGSYKDSAQRAAQLNDEVTLAKGREAYENHRYSEAISLLSPYSDREGILPMIEDAKLRTAEGITAFGENGVALFQMKGKGATIGLINTKGEVVLPPTYEDFKIGFRSGVAAVKDTTGRWGFIDETGKEIVPLQYDSVTVMNDGFALARQGKKQLIISNKGETVQELPGDKTFDDLLSPQLLSEKEGGSLYLAGPDGKRINKTAFLSIGRFTDGMSVVKIKNKKKTTTGVINEQGKYVVKPGKYDEIRIAGPDTLLVRLPDTKQKKDQWGIINGKGKVIAKCGTYVDLNPDRDAGVIYAPKGKGWGAMNLAGEWLLQPEYGKITGSYRQQLFFSLLIQGKTRMLNMIDTTHNNRKIETKLKTISIGQSVPFFPVVEETNGYWQIMDAEGKIVW